MEENARLGNYPYAEVSTGFRMQAAFWLVSLLAAIGFVIAIRIYTLYGPRKPDDCPVTQAYPVCRDPFLDPS